MNGILKSSPASKGIQHITKLPNGASLVWARTMGDSGPWNVGIQKTKGSPVRFSRTKVRKTFHQMGYSLTGLRHIPRQQMTAVVDSGKNKSEASPFTSLFELWSKLKASIKAPGAASVIYYPEGLHTEVETAGWIYNPAFEYQRKDLSSAVEKTKQEGRKGFVRFVLALTECELQQMQDFLAEQTHSHPRDSCVFGTCRALQSAGFKIPFPFNAYPTLNFLYLSALHAAGSSRVVRIEKHGSLGISFYDSVFLISGSIMIFLQIMKRWVFEQESIGQLLLTAPQRVALLAIVFCACFLMMEQNKINTNKTLPESKIIGRAKTNIGAKSIR